MIQPDNHSTQPDDDEPLLDGEDIACLGMHRADDPFRDLNGSWPDDAFAKPSKPTAPRKPRLRTVLDQAKKAGATAVTRDGVTYTFGQAEQQTDTDREIAEFEARHGKA